MSNQADLCDLNQSERLLKPLSQVPVSNKVSGVLFESSEVNAARKDSATDLCDDSNHIPETRTSDSTISINSSDEGYVTLRQSTNGGQLAGTETEYPELESRQNQTESRIVSNLINEQFDFLNDVLEGKSVYETDNQHQIKYNHQTTESIGEIDSKIDDTNLKTHSIEERVDCRVTEELPHIAEGTENSHTHEPPIEVDSVTMRPCIEKDDNEDDDDDDDITGTYDESYRSSKWIFDEEELENATPSNEDLPSISENTIDEPTTLPDERVNGPMTRTDSMSTTASEYEYRRPYREFSVKRVKREGSQQTFIRENTAHISADKKVVLTRDGSDTKGLGFHVNGSLPTYISTIVPGSQADGCGMKVGDVIIAINYENVLHRDHDEIVALLKADCERLTVELCKETSLSIMRKEEGLNTTVYSGHMLKLTNTILGIWKKRWFELKSDNCLYYYKHQNATDILGAIPLTGYSMQKAIDLKWKKPNSLKLVHHTKTYYLASECESEYTDWALHINTATNQSTRRPSLTGGALNQPDDSNMSDVWMDVSSHNVGLPALSIASPDCQGFLHKQGGRHRSWKKRYAVLKNGCLYYYCNMESSSARGVAHLHGYLVECSPVSSKRNAFDLIPPETTMRTFHFYCSTEIERDRWTTAMMKSIGRWIKIDS